MTTRDLLLAIDNGTQSLKAMIFDPAGQLLAISKKEFSPYYSPHPGWAEQDPAVFWQALCDVCNGLWQDKAVDRNSLAGVALTTQRATVINVDAAGQPLRPAILWLDQRKTYGLPPVGGLWGLLFKILGLHPTIDYFQAEAESNWIRTHERTPGRGPTSTCCCQAI